MRLPLLCACVLALAGCARSAADLFDQDGSAITGVDAGSANGGGSTGDGSGGEPDASASNGTGSNGTGNTGTSSNGSSGADGGSGGANSGASSGTSGTNGNNMPMSCTGGACATPTSDLGKMDGSDDKSTLTYMGMGSAFLRVTATDGNKGGAGNGTAGVKVSLAAPSESKYEVYVLGDLSGGDACAQNKSSPGTSGETTAIWNCEGPIQKAADRQLTIEVRHVSGPCDAPWTLTVSGDPCPNLLPPGDSCN